MSNRLPNLTTPSAKLQKRLNDIFIQPFRRLSANQLFWGGFVLLTLATTFVIQNPFWRARGGEIYREGDIVRESIISPADITYTDYDETEKVLETLRDSVKPIFTLESNRSEQAVQNFRSSWENLQRHGDDSTGEKSNSNARANSRESGKTEIHWTGAGGEAVGVVLASRNFSSNELEAVTRALRETSDGSTLR